MSKNCEVFNEKFDRKVSSYRPTVWKGYPSLFYFSIASTELGYVRLSIMYKVKMN